ncbi:unnamed protein product [Kluyveromyces dobzhanskii CBS 2104]|uniref:WGS project CCBQ000000000 data, contig 00011 n=1 Tax=Kluyveromyces dobzhanskii CBS 2104 TaxID=1427455 RepID=A0A0A8L9W6_9SACH|nr:unnamed protein product [Kluyveromyces dobzhanskii CBS 2104]
MPGQLVNVPFCSQVEDMDTYLSEYRASKKVSQQYSNQPYQAAHRYNQQIKSVNGQCSGFTNLQHQQQQNNRKKYNNGTSFTQSTGYNPAYRQQGNASKYNQQYQHSVTSMYNKAVHQQAYSSGLYANYNTPSNNHYSKNGMSNLQFNNHPYESNIGNDNGYSNIIPNDGNGAQNSALSFNQLNDIGNNPSQIASYHTSFSPTTSVSPPPIPPSRLSSTLSSVSVGSSVSNDMDFIMPIDMNNSRSFGQQQGRFFSQQQYQQQQQQQQQGQQVQNLQQTQKSQQAFPTFGNNFIEQSFSQGHDFMNPITPSSSLIADGTDPQASYGSNLYSAGTLSSNFMLSEPAPTWNNEPSAQPNASSVSIWNSDMSVWS